MCKKIRAVGAGILVAVWLGLTGFAWFGPDKDISEAERRPLTQFPEISMKKILDGNFMKNFEDYTLDQFPLRDSFRQGKSLMHYYALNQKDNNDIYLADGYEAKMEYPYNSQSSAYAISKFSYIYEHYLKEQKSKIYCAVVPDKGYYLAEKNGYLSMDYDAMFQDIRQGMPWATHIDLTQSLAIDDYYRTDTHWRQEKIISVAQKICSTMDAVGPDIGDYRQIQLEKPFYGVYYGQAALPVKSEPMFIMRSDLLDDCVVTNFETNKTGNVYDESRMHGKDLYDVFLSGSVSLIQIENPSGKSDKELIIFRDSFGSSLAPLILNDYKTVTLVDIRYLGSAALENFIDFHGQDALFLYSTLVLNNATTLK